MNIMKKFRILILALAATAAFSACQDALDLRSNGTIDMSEVFKDRNRTKGYLNACYNYIKNPSVNVGSFTDDAQNSQDITAGSSYDIWYNSDITSSNFADHNWDGNPWGNYFEGVRKCNVFIANIDGATAEMLDWIVLLNSALYWSTNINGFLRPSHITSPLYFPAVHSFQSFR